MASAVALMINAMATNAIFIALIFMTMAVTSVT